MARSRSIGAGVAVVLTLTGTITACGAGDPGASKDPPLVQDATQPLERQWLGELKLERSIGDRPPVVLGLPDLLTAGPDGGFALADFGDEAVSVFDAEGRRRWSFGREGKGPGEFARFTSLTFYDNGEIAVLDPELQRVTRIDADGTLVSTTNLPNASRKLLPVGASAGGWVLMPDDNEHLWVQVTRDGQQTAATGIPSELQVQASLISEPFTSRSTMGAVIAYRWSSRLAFLDREGAVRGIINGVENVDFPTLWKGNPAITRVDPEATPAARDVSAASGKVFVLFTGASANDTRAVDVYDEMSMAYLGSYRVAASVMNIAALSDGRLATLEHDPIPIVKIWSMGKSPTEDGRSS